MHDQLIKDLEASLSEIEGRIEEDDVFVDGDEFETLYEKLEELFKDGEREVDSFPYGDANDAMEEKFELFREKFDKCKKRKKRIDDTADRDDGTGDWMEERDEDDLID